MTMTAVSDRCAVLSERARQAWARLQDSPGVPQWLDVPILVTLDGELPERGGIPLTVKAEDGTTLGRAMVYAREWYPNCQQQSPFSHYYPTLRAVLRARQLRAVQGDEAMKGPLRLQLLQAVAADTSRGQRIVVLLKFIIAPEYTLTGRQLETVYSCPLQMLFTNFLGVSHDTRKARSASSQVRGQVIHEAYRRVAAALIDGADPDGIDAAYHVALFRELAEQLALLCNPLAHVPETELRHAFNARSTVIEHCQTAWQDDKKPRRLYLERLLYSPSRGISGRVDRIEEPASEGHPWCVVEVKTTSLSAQRDPTSGERHPGGLQAMAYWEILRSLGVQPADARVELIESKGAVRPFSLAQHALTIRAKISWGKPDDPHSIDLIAQARNIGYCVASGLFTGYDRQRLDRVMAGEGAGFRLRELQGRFDLMADAPPCSICPARSRGLCGRGWKATNFTEAEVPPLRNLFSTVPDRLFRYWSWFHRQLKEEERRSREALFHLIATPVTTLELQDGVTLQGLRLADRTEHLVCFEREQPLETRIREDDTVLVTPEQYLPGQLLSVEGRVRAVEERRITVVLEDDRLPEEAQTFRLDLITGHDMRQWQLEGLTDFLLMTMESARVRGRKLFLSELPALAQTLLGVRPPVTPATVAAKPLPATLIAGLNDEQRTILATALAMKPGDLLLIQGPPGTGKTQLIAAIARAVFMHQMFLPVSDRRPVLVLANTHRAANEVVLKLLRLDARLSPFLVRFGAGRQSRLEEGVKEHVLSERLQLTQVLEQIAQSLSGQEHDAVAVNTAVRQLWETIRRGQTILEHAGIFVGTLGSAASAEVRGLSFDTVIVDEAGQATEPAMLQALRRLPSGYQGRLILVGDHCQLPPVVAQEIKPPPYPGLAVLGLRDSDSLRTSAFERLARLYPDALQTLHQQYRMNAPICQLVSDTFYAGQLVPGTEQVARQRLADWLRMNGLSPVPGLLSGDPPIVLVETTNDPSARDTGAGASGLREESWANPREAEIIARLLSDWIAAFPEDARPMLVQGIGVISPYRRQNTLIRHALAQRDPALKHVHVDTVDRFQGGERPIIVLSLVNSNPQHNIGSLHADWRRMNVALSRAQYLLVIVGDPATFTAEPSEQASAEEREARQRYRALFACLRRLAVANHARIVSSLSLTAEDMR